MRCLGNGGGRGGGGGGGGGGRKGGTGGKDGDGEGGQEKKKALEGIVRIAFSGLQSGDRQVIDPAGDYYVPHSVR